VISTPSTSSHYTIESPEYLSLSVDYPPLLDYQQSCVDMPLVFFDNPNNEPFPFNIDECNGDVLQLNDVWSLSHTPSSKYDWDDELCLLFPYVFSV
jgi:hypothetical protein